MSDDKREEIDEEAGLYVISVAAELSGTYIHKHFANTIALDLSLRHVPLVAIADIRCAILHPFAPSKDLSVKESITRASKELLNLNQQWQIWHSKLQNFASKLMHFSLENPPKSLELRKKSSSNYLQRRELAL
jgi:hypothetical protein